MGKRKNRSFWAIVDVVFSAPFPIPQETPDDLPPANCCSTDTAPVSAEAPKFAKGYIQTIGCNMDGKESVAKEIKSFVLSRDVGVETVEIDECNAFPVEEIAVIVRSHNIAKNLEFHPAEDLCGIWYHSGRIFY